VRLSLRLFLGYSLIIVLGGWLFFNEFSKVVRPGLRQSLEESLVDTANLLAELVAREVVEGRITQGEFAQGMARYGERRFNARIWSLTKRFPHLFVYVTDAKGILVYDSRGRGLGADYSRWNDVYLTLRGQYGARSSPEDPNDEGSSVMYVAAPVLAEGRLAGVLTVAKPSLSVQPFVDQLRRQLMEKGVWLALASLPVVFLLSIWLTASVRRLTAYALEARAGRRVAPPRPREPELAQLAEAMEAMRVELEGKDYVERYLHTLTHELKSPLAAIQGAGELLQEEMPAAARARFLGNIRAETQRMQRIVERLLHLAVVEKRQSLQDVEPLDPDQLARTLCEEKAPQCQAKGLQLQLGLEGRARVSGERFLLRQAMGNLIDNAIDFSPPGGLITLDSAQREGAWTLTIGDQGPGIPDYAIERVFERFYSLPRPNGGGKSTGIGLAFVKEVAELHGGSVRLENREGSGGAVVSLSLPVE